MQLLDHVSISVQDIARAKRFYSAILSTLGAVVVSERDEAISFGERNRPNDDKHTYLSIYQSTQAISDPRRHWCFRAQSKEQVNAFHAAGLEKWGQAWHIALFIQHTKPDP